MSPSDIRSDGLPVIIGDKAEQAYELKKQGKTWAEVARIAGYESASVASIETKRWLTSIAVTKSTERREEILEMELERLDSLLSAVWDQAMDGDTKAVDSALRVINTRAKLLSLDQLTATSVTQNFNTVVVDGNTSKDFISQLKLVES
jgi:hypothetical protein